MPNTPHSSCSLSSSNGWVVSIRCPPPHLWLALRFLLDQPIHGPLVLVTVAARLVARGLAANRRAGQRLQGAHPRGRPARLPLGTLGGGGAAIPRAPGDQLLEDGDPLLDRCYRSRRSDPARPVLER